MARSSKEGFRTEEADAQLQGLRLRPVIDQLQEGFQLLDRELRYQYLNAAAETHARRPIGELIGRRMQDCYPGIDETPLWAKLQTCLSERVPDRLQNEFVYPDGRRATFELRIEPTSTGLVILSTDISDRLELQRQLRQAQKMEAIGRLAGGVAHDFNNLLTVIDGFAELGLERLPARSPAADDVQEIRHAVRRATELTRKLLTFSREASVQPERLEINRLVTGMHAVLERALGGAHRLSTRLAPELWPVEADSGGIEQILLNLAVNARDAMPEGGLLRIETSNHSIDEPLRMRWGRPIQAGDYVVLSVTDTGVGIAPEILDKIFDPFFTTKPPGQGTGLGLSVCLGIAEQAGGYVNVYSEPGQGTTFRVYLPRTNRRRQVASEAPEREAPAGRGVVAVVEDDPQIRGLIVRALERAGYRVSDHADAAAAEERLRSMTELDLVVTDVVMPKLSGPELAARLRGARPDLRVLFVSGYPGGSARGADLVVGGKVLEKPFTTEELLRAVRLALGG